MSKMFDYLFILGNSHKGPIALSAHVIARCDQEALAILRERLPDSLYVRKGREYIEIYLSPSNISVADIFSREGVDVNS